MDRRKRIIDEEAHRVTTYASIKEFVGSSQLSAGINVVDHAGVPIDLLISPQDSDTLIVFFHGAIEPHFILPVLSGSGISGGLQASRVFVSDPSLLLDERLLLGWFAGNAKQPDLQTILRQLLEKVAAWLGATRVVFFGGSGGGFASLQLAPSFKNSLALVFNPQTTIAKYLPRVVRDYVSLAFDVNVDQAKPLQSLPDGIVTNVIPALVESSSTTVAYMQNLNDERHVKYHLRPLLKEVDRQGQLLLRTERWRKGHTPPPKELLAAALNAVSVGDDWSAALGSIGFEEFVPNEATP